MQWVSPSNPHHPDQKDDMRCNEHKYICQPLDSPEHGGCQAGDLAKKGCIGFRNQFQSPLSCKGEDREIHIMYNFDRRPIEAKSTNISTKAHHRSD